MADYYVDSNGIVTKKKKLSDYMVDINGNVTKREEEIDEELAPVKRNSYVEDAISDAEFSLYSQKGASIVNPTAQDATKGLAIAGWRPFAEEVANPVTFSRENYEYIKLAELNGAGRKTDPWSSSYHYMTDDEVSVYNYYLAKYGKDRAAEFLESIADDLAKREGGEISKNVSGNTAAQIILAGGAGLDSAAQGLSVNMKNLVTGSEEVTKPTASMYANQELAQGYEGAMKVANDVAYGVGYMAPSLAVGALNPAAGAATMGVSVAGNKYNEMIERGYTVEQAQGTAIVVGAAEGVSQYLMGGIGKLGGKGLSKIASKITPGVTSKITETIAKVTANTPAIYQALGKAAVEMGKEGAEEALQTYLEPAIESWFTNEAYDAPDFEEVVYSALIGALTSFGLEGAPGIASAAVDTVSGKATTAKSANTETEKAVVEREIASRVAEAEAGGKKLTVKERIAIEKQVTEDLEKGRISTDTIETVLGGDTYKAFEEGVKGFDENETYKAYQEAVAEEKAIREEFEELQNMKAGEATIGQQERYNELKARIESFKTKSRSTELRAQLEPEIQRINALKKQLQQEVSEKVKGDRLSESYRELQRSREKFQADVSKYENEHARKTIQNLIDGGIANNTNEFHEFADMLAKWSADKGLEFDAMDNKKLSGTRYEVKGATVNAFVTEDGKITFNVDSKKRLNSLAGHEITHVLEGTKFYDTLAKAVKEYATAKGEWDTRLASVTELYKKYNPKADPVKELTADLVGDYIFTDKAFLETLSVKHRNIFQFLWDEIKYMAKTATAGSKEARALERAKKAFADAYRASGKVQAKGGAGYSLTEYTDHQKQNWSDSKRIVVYESPEQLASYVQDSISGKIQHKKMYFGAISSDLASRIEADTGLNVENYNLSLGSDEILKVLKDHGNEKTEAPRGQRAITEADFSHIVDVVLNPTKIKLSDTTYNGKPAIIFTGEFNGRMNVTAVVSDKRLDLFVQTMYVNVKRENLSTPIGEQAPINTPEANSGTVSSETIIAENSEKSSGEVKKSLSPEQEEFFKDSVVRDEDGNLKVMYHGTSAGGHTVFDPYGASRYGLFGLGTYFTDNKEIAESYTKKGKGTNPQVYETYLNITNPMDMDAPADPSAWAKVFPDADFPESGTNEDFYRAMEDYFEDMEYVRWEAHEAAMDAIMSMGHDGITHIGGGRVNADGPRHRVYIAFTPEQIKSTDNAKPTGNADIRYSISEDSEGRDLSNAVRNRFANSKAVDENGNLKVLFHGTASGEFSVFDKTKGSVEGDFGSGFYFTDNEADVSEHYEGGGPDFENKVARRAEQIEAEEDIDYDDAEKRAREELFKGSHKFEVYLNIENPAIVGETLLFDNDSYLEQYNEDDYESYDDYIGDVEQLLADDIENIIWEVERTTGAYSTNGLSEVLYDAYYEGGIGIEELKSRINDLYLEDETGNLIGNEVTRQVIESLGYDGIIDPTVSSKWNMDIEEGTTHYIVFKPNQIKAVTNQNPTDNPDIHLSLSERGGTPGRRGGGYAVYGENVRVRDPAESDFAPLPPMQENAAPVQKEIASVEEPVQTAGEEEYAPISAEEAGQRDAGIAFPGDADAPPEREAPYYGEEIEELTPDDPFENRDIDAVGNRKIKAYMYENPEVKPFFQEEANVMLGELNRTIKGERIFAAGDFDGYGAESYYKWMGTKRQTSDDIAYLLDTLKYSYAEIEKGLKAIIEDDGKENNAVSKRIEFLLNDRLLNGYRDMDFGYEYPPNQDYVNLLNEKQITEYNEEARARLFENADSYAPPVEDIAPVATPAAAPAKDIAPVREEYEAITPEREAEAPAEDIAPVMGERMVRLDSNNGRPGEKQRKWVRTSTGSDAVDGKILPDDLNQDTIHYQPISNKATLGEANTRLSRMGYESSVTYFNSQFANKKISLEDIALGERLIQEAVKRGDTKTAGELIQNVALLGTELGQKVQALSIIKRLTPEGQLGLLKKTIERGKTKGDKTFEGVELTQEMIDKILSVYGEDGTYDQAQLNDVVEDVKKDIADQMKVTKLEKVNAWRYLAMLGNPKTHIRNIVSNVAMRGTVAVKNAVARTIESVAPIGNRTKTWAPTTAEVQAFAKKTALEMKETLTDDSKYNEAASIKEKRAIFQNKVLNAVYEFNSNLLTKEDWWFSRPAFENSLAEFLTANGIRTEADIQAKPELVEKAKLYATEQSQIATFRQYSWLAHKISEMENANTAANIAIGSILPFKRTPINIAKAGLNYSPLGFMKTLTYDASRVKNGKMEASEMVDHLAQNVTGTALTLVGYLLASAGFLSGGGEDDKEGEYDYQLGEQAYSVNIGGTSYSLSWLSPVAMPLFVGANAYEQLVEGKEWNGDVVVETLAQTLDPLNEMSFLSGLTSVLSSYDSGMQKFAGIGETMVQNYASQFVPTSLSQVATVMDDTKRTTKVSGDSDNKFVDGTINKLKYKIPGLRETLEPTTDIWGNEIKQTENVIARAFETFIAPYSKRENIATDIDAEIKEIYSQTGDGGVIPSIPSNYVNYGGEKYEMSGEEYTAFKSVYGQVSYDLLRELMNSGVYKEAGADERADMVNKVYDYARDEAKRALLESRGVEYTNASADGEAYYREDSIKGAIENNMTPDEYSYARENPEKYNFLKEKNVSYAEYQSFDDEAKDAWTWAYNNPDSFTLSKAVSGDVVQYRRYAKALSDIPADKDANGKTISGSRKEKVIEYINNLDADYGQKIILFKSEYNADDTYNNDIIEYLDSRADITYEEMVAILTKLGFKVSGNNVTW